MSTRHLTSFKLSAEVYPAFQFINLAGTRRGRLGSLCTRARDRLALGTVLTVLCVHNSSLVRRPKAFSEYFGMLVNDSRRLVVRMLTIHT